MTEKLLHGKRIGCRLQTIFIFKVLSFSCSFLSSSRQKWDWDKDEISYLKVTQCNGEDPVEPILAMSSAQAKACAGSEQDHVRSVLGQGNKTKD